MHLGYKLDQHHIVFKTEKEFDLQTLNATQIPCLENESQLTSEITMRVKISCANILDEKRIKRKPEVTASRKFAKNYLPRDPIVWFW